MSFFKKPAAAGDAYARHRERMGKRSKKASTSGRDIGPLPPIRDPERRAEAFKSLAFMCLTYFRAQFTLAFSEDHLKYCRKIDATLNLGGTIAQGMPRGGGKTTIAEVGAIKGAVFGIRRFEFLIAADGDKAGDILTSIKVELETNDLLLDDFPEVCFPIRCLEGIAQRATGQLYQGERTDLKWHADHIVLPTIAGSPASGVIVKTKGITGGIRGAKHKLRDGTSLRPDFVLIDDPQTRESAMSDQQCKDRLAIITNDVLGLAGPDKAIAAVAAVTVIRPGDVADELLDQELHPEWQGDRAKLVYRWPEDTEHWEAYAEMRREDQRVYQGDDRARAFERCNAYYAEHRAAMDAGAVVAWPERFNSDELSAIQHAMNLRIDRGDDYVAAEMQNEPRVEESAESPLLTIEEVLVRANNRGRGEVPVGCEVITAFCDLQGECLIWLVAAFRPDFTPYILDVGTTPEQRVKHWTKATLTKKLADIVPVGGKEARWYGGLEAFGTQVLGRAWVRDDGMEMRIKRCLVDMSDGDTTNTVFKWAKETPFAAIVTPSQGVGVTADSVPISQYKRKERERIGEEWILGPNQRGLLFVRFDANYWKTQAENRIRTPKGDTGALTVFGKESDHRLLAAHFTSELRTRTTGRNRAVDVWKQKPSRPDNDLWDGAVGALVAASMEGVTLGVGKPAPPAKRKRRGNVDYGIA